MKLFKKLWRFRLLIAGTMLLAAAMAVSVQGSFGGFDVEVGPGGFDSEFSGWNEESGGGSDNSGFDISGNNENTGGTGGEMNLGRNGTGSTENTQNSGSSGNLTGSSDGTGAADYVEDDWESSGSANSGEGQNTGNTGTGYSDLPGNSAAGNTGSRNPESGENIELSGNSAGENSVAGSSSAKITNAGGNSSSSQKSGNTSYRNAGSQETAALESADSGGAEVLSRTPTPVPTLSTTPHPTPTPVPTPSSASVRTAMADTLSKENMVEIPGTSNLFPETDCLQPMRLFYWQGEAPPGQAVLEIDEKIFEGVFSLRVNHKESDWEKHGKFILVELPDNQQKNQIELITVTTDGYCEQCAKSTLRSLFWTKGPDNGILSSSSR